MAISAEVDEPVQRVDEPLGSLVSQPVGLDRVHDVAQRRDVRAQPNPIHGMSGARLNVNSHLEDGTGVCDVDTFDLLDGQTAL